MYSINGLENIFDVIAYTSTALKESGYTDSEIEDYVSSALEQENNLEIIELSKSWLNECNSIFYNDDKYYNADDYNDGDYINDCYSCFWDDDGERYSTLNDDEDNESNDDIWDYGVEHNDEAYEGYSSCKNYRWDSR